MLGAHHSQFALLNIFLKAAKYVVVYYGHYLTSKNENESMVIKVCSPMDGENLSCMVDQYEDDE